MKVNFFIVSRVKFKIKMPHIFDWKCSYYHKPDGKWFYGKLKLYQHSIRFKAQDDTAVSLTISDIVDVKRRTTNIFYNAIVITYIGKENFWFSSFDNVYNVLSVIEHFWREMLLGPENGRQDQRNQQGSNTRNELLDIAYESQDTLMSTARELCSQGEQIRNAAAKMDKLHSDLRIAEYIVSDLESWFGGWKVSSPNPTAVTNQKKSPLSSQRSEYAVLVAKTSQESHTPSILVLGAKNIEIFGKKNSLLYSFGIHQLSYATVHSPYDMTFVRQAIGKPDVKVHVISTRLPYILKTFESMYQYKPIYEDLPTSSDDEAESNWPMLQKKTIDLEDNKSMPSTKNLETRKQLFQGHTGALTNSPYDLEIGSKKGEQQMKTKQIKQLSDSDANELTAVLKNMKAMAVDISHEQELQNDQLDRLTQSVQRADTKIKEDNRTVKTML